VTYKQNFTGNFTVYSSL